MQIVPSEDPIHNKVTISQAASFCNRLWYTYRCSRQSTAMAAAACVMRLETELYKSEMAISTSRESAARAQHLVGGLPTFSKEVYVVFQGCSVLFCSHTVIIFAKTITARYGNSKSNVSGSHILTL